MKILIADDNYEIRSALRLLIEQEPGMTVITEAVDTATLQASAAATQPDLILLDSELPGCEADYGNTIKTLQETEGKAVIVVMSIRSEDRLAALKAGADSFVCQGDGPEKLLAVLRKYFNNGSKGGNG
jgi:DNA-binding NarL/FixJ family response regulator